MHELLGYGVLASWTLITEGEIESLQDTPWQAVSPLQWLHKLLKNKTKHCRYCDYINEHWSYAISIKTDNREHHSSKQYIVCCKIKQKPTIVGMLGIYYWVFVRPKDAWKFESQNYQVRWTGLFLLFLGFFLTNYHGKKFANYSYTSLLEIVTVQAKYRKILGWRNILFDTSLQVREFSTL